MVIVSHTPRKLSWRRSRAAAVVDGADMGVMTTSPATELTTEEVVFEPDVSAESQCRCQRTQLEPEPTCVCAGKVGDRNTRTLGT